MSAFLQTLLVGIGGFAGSISRYWMTVLVSGRMPSNYPIATMSINVFGSFLIGLVVGWTSRSPQHEPWRLLVAVGVLGGFTTFSTFSLETIRLLEARNYGIAAVNITASVALSLIGSWVGLALMRN